MEPEYIPFESSPPIEAIETIPSTPDAGSIKLSDLNRIFSGEASLVEFINIAIFLGGGAWVFFTGNRFAALRSDVSRILNLAQVDSLKKENKIESLIGHLMGVTLCDRVIIGLFTEDEKYLTLPYEVVNIGYSSITEKVTKVAVENIKADLELVGTDKFSRVDRNNETVSVACRQYLESVNLVALDSRKILSPSNKVIGVIQLHYMKTPTNWTSHANATNQAETIFNRLRYDLSAE